MSEQPPKSEKPRDVPTLLWCASECEARAQDSDAQAAQLALFGAAECFRATAEGDERSVVSDRDWKAEVAALAHALGIEYAPDTGPTWPGDLDAMLRAIADLQERSRLWIDHELRSRDADSAEVER